ncbi:hypothetical protein ACFL45_12055 [Candidatus Neomarinimicrobiota bacterium]
MVLIRKHLNTGMVQPQCAHHAGTLFCRDARVCHQVQLNGNSVIQTETPSLSLDIVGGGIRYCDINCAHCLSEASQKRPI